MNSARYSQVYLCLIVLAVIGTLFIPDTSGSFLIVGLAIAVTFLGLPHGALDFSVAKDLKLVSSFGSACTFLFVYILIAGLSIVFWLQFPAAGLILFFAISIYHFASDWRKVAPAYASLSLASIILCGSALFYSTNLVQIFTALLVSEKMAKAIVLGMRVVFCVSSLVFTVFLIRRLRTTTKINKWHLTEYITLILSSLVLTPLLHFGLYFCALHSPKHMADVGAKLTLSLWQTILVSLPFVGLTILIAAGLFLWFGSANINTNLLRWTFIGLFGLTMSHMFLITIWHRSASATR